MNTESFMTQFALFSSTGALKESLKALGRKATPASSSPGYFSILNVHSEYERFIITWSISASGVYISSSPPGTCASGFSQSIKTYSTQVI